MLTILNADEYINNMFSLNIERGKFIVVRGGVNATVLIDIYKMPINGELYDGKIIEVLPISGYCYAQVGDSYEKIAKRENCNLNELKSLNCNSTVYPTKRIWLP